MMHATPWWIAGADGGLECSNSEPCIDRAADGVTYDPTGPSIEDRSQVHKAGRDCDIGDIGYPQLVRTIQFHVLREIGEDRIIVIAIRRRDKTPPLLWIQRMLAHEPASNAPPRSAPRRASSARESRCSITSICSSSAWTVASSAVPGS